MIQQRTIPQLRQLLAKIAVKEKKVRSRWLAALNASSAEELDLEARNRLQQHLNKQGCHVWLLEDCASLKRGRILTAGDLDRIDEKGYEVVAVSTTPIDDYINGSSAREKLLANRNLLVEKLHFLFDEIDEKTAGYQKGSSRITLLEDGDLLRRRLTPLQREGAAKVAAKILGPGGKKLEQIRPLILAIYKQAVRGFCLYDNRSYGNALARMSNPNLKDDRGDYLEKHCATVATAFAVTLFQLQKERIEQGAQSSSARFTAGQSFNRTKRTQYSQEMVEEAILAAAIFDIGFLHRHIKDVMENEMYDMVGGDGEIIQDGFEKIEEGRFKLLKKHTYTGAHLVRELNIGSTALVSSMINYHHAYLNGEGFPPRREEKENLIYGNPNQFKRTITRYKLVPGIHELTHLLTVIDKYYTLINRRPWRLPVSRHDACEWLLANAFDPIDIETGEKDTAGKKTFPGEIKCRRRFEMFMVKLFLYHIVPYGIGEALPVLRISTGKQVTTAVVSAYSKIPYRPIIRTSVKGKVIEIDLSEEKHSDYALGEFYPTCKLPEDAFPPPKSEEELL